MPDLVISDEQKTEILKKVLQKSKQYYEEAVIEDEKKMAEDSLSELNNL